MARVTLLEERDLPDHGALVAKIKGSRGKLINLYRVLLHAPGIAEKWLEFINAIRAHAVLDELTRELAIMRIATLNATEYVLRIHGGGMAQKAGMTDRQIAAIADWRGSPAFNERERAVLAYVDAMTRDLEVPDEVFAALRRHFDEHAVVELSILVGCYNMHTRVMRALKLDVEPS
jgi:alkylhydroperoxidase family enzyme